MAAPKPFSRRPAFLLWLFLVWLGVFSWPYITRSSVMEAWLHHFLTWALLVLLLLLLSRTGRGRGRAGGPDAPGGET